MFNLSTIIKEARWIGKISLLQEMQMKNMVGQLFAKYKDKFKLEEVSKEKEKFLGFANKINDEVIKNLKVDFKNEKIVLVWILEQVLNKTINESILEEDLEVIKENLSIYFENKGKINKTLDKINYNELKKIVKDYKKGGEEEKHQEFLSKPLYEGNDYKIYKITEVDQCLKIGKGTSWCIQGEKYAKKYLKEGPLYLVTKNDKRFALLSFESTQFMDVQDNRLSEEVLEGIFKVFPPEVFSKLILESTIKEPRYLKYIENPSEELLKKIVKSHPYGLKYIKNPSEELQLLAVSVSSGAIEYIKNPSEKVQLVAVNNNGRVLQYIKNPTPAVQLAAVKQDAYSLKYIENPSEEVQLAAVQYGPSIQFIENPSEKVQLEAVKRNPIVIEYIKNPTQKVKEYVESQK